MTGNFDLMWIQQSSLDVISHFPLHLGLFIRVCENTQLRETDGVAVPFIAWESFVEPLGEWVEY